MEHRVITRNDVGEYHFNNAPEWLRELNPDRDQWIFGRLDSILGIVANNDALARSINEIADRLVDVHRDDLIQWINVPRATEFCDDALFDGITAADFSSLLQAGQYRMIAELAAEVVQNMGGAK